MNKLKTEVDPSQLQLTEEQNEALANEAYAEIEAEKKSPVNLDEKPEEDPKKDPEPEKEPEEDPKKEKESEEGEESEEDPKKDPEKEPEEKPKEGEDKPGEGDPKEEKSEDEIKAEAAAKEEQVIQEYALKETLTLDEAREEIAGQKAIAEKYKNDPMALAKAYQHTQRGYDKIRGELDASKDKANEEQPKVAPNLKQIEAGLVKNKEAYVAKYRETYPGLTEDQSENAVFDMFKKDFMDRYHQNLNQKSVEDRVSAKEKRSALLESLDEDSKKYLPDVKVVLDDLEDSKVLSGEVDINDIVFWAKGRDTDRLVKEAEARGYKKGQEEATIAGEKIPGSDKKTKKSKVSETKPVDKLTEEQKERALAMFDGTVMSDDEKIDAYMEVYKDELEKGDKYKLSTT